MEIKTAIDRAKAHVSKVPNEYLDKLTGLSSHKVWHLLNNICAGSSRYLEVGTYMGSTLMAALYGNDHVNAWAIDNFCMKPRTRGHFFHNTKHLNFKFIEQDAFQVDTKQITGIDLYFYDGEHSYESQFKALDHFIPSMANEFVYICDDYNNEEAIRGTINAIAKNGLTIVESYALGNGKMKDKDGWWCGVGIIKLKKS